MSPLPSLLLLSSEGGGSSLTDIDLTLFVSTLVLFLIFALVLGKFAWKPLLEIVAEREKTVRDQVEGAEKARNEAKVRLGKRQEMLKDATRQREETIAAATRQAGHVRHEVMGRARAEAGQVVQKARAQI